MTDFVHHAQDLPALTETEEQLLTKLFAELDEDISQKVKLRAHLSDQDYYACFDENGEVAASVVPFRQRSDVRTCSLTRPPTALESDQQQRSGPAACGTLGRRLGTLHPRWQRLSRAAGFAATFFVASAALAYVVDAYTDLDLPLPFTQHADPIAQKSGQQSPTQDNAPARSHAKKASEPQPAPADEPALDHASARQTQQVAPASLLEPVERAAPKRNSKPRPQLEPSATGSAPLVAQPEPEPAPAPEQQLTVGDTLDDWGKRWSAEWWQNLERVAESPSPNLAHKTALIEELQNAVRQARYKCAQEGRAHDLLVKVSLKWRALYDNDDWDTILDKTSLELPGGCRD